MNVLLDYAVIYGVDRPGAISKRRNHIHVHIQEDDIDTAAKLFWNLKVQFAKN